MASTQYFRQCKLVRKTAGVVATQVSYLPEVYAKKGQIVKLKDSDGKWVDGWRVESAGERVEKDKLPDPHKAIKEHRNNTGDSQPKK